MSTTTLPAISGHEIAPALPERETESSASPHSPDGAASLVDRFTGTYEAHFVGLCRFLRRLGVRPGDLEDVCHEIFVVFHRRMDDVLPGVSDRAFLYGIGARAAADYRRLKRHEEIELDDEAAPAGARVAHPETLYAMRRDLERALEQLALDRRTVLVMHELEGMSAPEMSAILGVPLNTVYSKLRLARADFERAVSRASAMEGRDG